MGKKKDETSEERAARKAAKKADETAEERAARKAAKKALSEPAAASDDEGSPNSRAARKAAKKGSKAAESALSTSPVDRQMRKAGRSLSPASPAPPSKSQRERDLQKDFETKNQRSHDRQRASPLVGAVKRENNPLQGREKRDLGSPKRGRVQGESSPPEARGSSVARRSGSIERRNLALPKVAPPPAPSPPKMRKAQPAPKFDDGTVTRHPVDGMLPDDKKSIAQIKREMRDLNERIKAIPVS
jgi:hypothetical protein